MREKIHVHELSDEAIAGRGEYLVVEVINDIQKRDRPLLPKGARLIVAAKKRGTKEYLCYGPKSYDPDNVAWKHLSVWTIEHTLVKPVGRVDHA